MKKIFLFVGAILITFHNKLQKNHSKTIHMKKLYWGKRTQCKVMIVAPLILV
jgi:hypothetical protein